jgi:hypothetical protein
MRRSATEVGAGPRITLPIQRQLAIASKIKPCIESLGLNYCSVHTEMKLLANVTSFCHWRT